MKKMKQRVALTLILLFVGSVFFLAKNFFVPKRNIQINYFDVGKKNTSHIFRTDSDGLQDGLQETFYESGKVYGHLVMNHGEVVSFKAWHENGKTYYIQPHVAGLPEGEWCWWDDKGNVLKKVKFLKGTGISYYFNKDFSIKKINYWIEGREATKDRYALRQN